VDPQRLFRPAALERLASPEQLDRLVTVADSQAWIMLATVGALLAIALAWSFAARIPSQITAPGVLAANEAIVFVSTNQGPLVQPGMPVRIASGAFPKEQYGTLAGRVRSISAAPQSAAQVRALVDNSELAHLVGGEEAPYAVRVLLDPAQGRGFALPAGMKLVAVTATIDYRTQAPIGLMIPALAQSRSTVP
jgi:hypothetical protein